jgi:hypothetical protein
MRIRRIGNGRLLPAAIAVAIIGVAVGLAWLDNRGPSSLPLPEHDLRAERTEATLRTGRKIEHFVLRTKGLGDIGIFVSLPEPLPRYKLPILIVLGGLGTGEQNIRYIPDAGDNAVIGYDWPMPLSLDGVFATLFALPTLYHQVMTIPAQVVSATAWLSAQPWADPKSVSILGFSLGALAAPAIENVAEHDGQPIGWTILAYGGDPFGALVAANPHLKPHFLRPILAPLVNILLSPLEPAKNLPRLSGEFLVLQGSDDSLIPSDARARFRDAVPEPKTVTTFDGDHMGVDPDKLGLLQQIIGASKLWLIDKGAIAPF